MTPFFFFFKNQSFMGPLEAARKLFFGYTTVFFKKLHFPLFGECATEPASMGR